MLTDSRAGGEWTSGNMRHSSEFFGDECRFNAHGSFIRFPIRRIDVDDFTYSVHGANDASERRMV